MGVYSLERAVRYENTFSNVRLETENKTIYLYKSSEEAHANRCSSEGAVRASVTDI